MLHCSAVDCSNSNVNFNIVFKTIHLCIIWKIKKFDNIKMYGSNVEKKGHIYFLLSLTETLLSPINAT